MKGKMMKAKKWIAVMAAGAMAMSILSGCGNRVRHLTKAEQMRPPQQRRRKKAQRCPRQEKMPPK